MAFEDNAEELLALLNPAISTPTVVSGTTEQDQTGVPSKVYAQITGASGGTVTVQIGAAGGSLTTIINAAATVNETVLFSLPAGWFYKITVTTATLGTVTQVTGA